MKGKILGSRYQVLEYIAEGGFGRTYLAADTQLPDRDLCVVKQLAPGFNAPKLLAVARRLFKTEAATLHRLGHHPQIPELLAYFEEAEKFYLVQQYIEGKTLDNELNSAQIWSIPKVGKFLRDCLKLLQYIHEQGVIHRDIKPANLIRRHSDRQIVLVDFGTVKKILQEQTSLPQLTVAVGTQGYMPIEQAQGKPRSTSDIYALGIIGIQALTGVKPLDLEDDDRGEIVWSHLVNTNHELIQILAKMTRCCHRERYQSAQSVLEALDNCVDTVVTLPQSAIATTLTTSRGINHGSTLANFKPNLDPNALPGVRSVAIVRSNPAKAKSKFEQGKFWKIAITMIILAGGVYISLQAAIFEPKRTQPESTQN
ncbi:MAG: serine/threonine-protein kinase [Cyanobacteria bacterium J06582_2]